MAVAVLLAACGESSSDSSEPGGKYDISVTGASFPTEQKLGQTSLLRLGMRNTGEKTVPTLTVTISVAGKQGEGASIPFAISERQEGLAQGDRPVWVLADRYPRFAGSSQPAGAFTANRKTFAFGPLKPGATTDVVWKLSAVRAGQFTLRYEVGAGLGGTAKVETKGGVAPGGSFVTEISAVPPETEVTDSGEVVETDTQPSGGEQDE